MPTQPNGDRLVWAIAIAGAILAVAVVLLLIAPPKRQPMPAARLGGGLGVQRVEGNALLTEQAELRDPMPLFQPVAWNTRPGAVAAGAGDLEGGSELARPFTGRLAFREEAAVVEFQPRVPLLARPADAIGQGEPDLPFLGMGRSDRPVAPPPARHAHLEVVRAETGASVMSEAIREVRVPATGDWQPLELLVVVDRAGLVAPPVVTRSSSIDGVDHFFREYLAKGLHLGERLNPGSYVITIGR